MKTAVFSTDRIDGRRQARRRRVFFTIIFVLTSLATWCMADLVWDGGVTATDVLLLALFVPLTAGISTGFATALLGYIVLTRGGDPCRVGRRAPGEEDTPLAGTAIVMPVCNEDVSRIFEGLRVIYRSVEATGHLAHFDFFILSDTKEENKWIQEEVAWVELCKQVGGFGRIFYRQRRQSINRKSGNIADFLRRWGRRYRYAIVLDADSIMTGDAIARLVRLMERNPGVGLIQTAPMPMNAATLFGRMQQFSGRLYGPMFLAGLNYWQQADGNYWGHNAIFRVVPFMDHCCLPELPGSEPFGGRILSHDYVEAALMRKAGWGVWLAYDIEGSYEEGPPTLIDHAKRDRRWCQGNLQHSWLFFARGFRRISRFHLLLGVFSYVASPLWLLFMLTGSVQVLDALIVGTATPHAAPRPGALFGGAVDMPLAVTLFIFTMALLFLPKVLGLAWNLGDPERSRSFGGPGRLAASALLETVFSVLLAPVHMLFHTKFIIFTLLGHGVTWVTQRRAGGDDDTDWREAIITHGGQTAFGLVWGASMFVLSPSYFAWLSPVIAGMVCSVPVSIFLSQPDLGRAAREAGLFLVPEETRPPSELARLRKNLAECYQHMRPIEALRDDYGLLQAVLDPYVNAVHVALLRQRRAGDEQESREYFSALCGRLLSEGPAQLAAREKRSLLLDAESMVWLHEQLWTQPGEKLSEWWRLALRQYNILTTAPVTALYR